MSNSLPLNPTVGQVFTLPSSGVTYRWDGEKWTTYSGGGTFQPVPGATGPSGPPGATGPSSTAPGPPGATGPSGLTGIGFIYNVKDYGARGDGSTNTALMNQEQTAIQNALNAAKQTGGTVFFPAGIYSVIGNLTIDYSAGTLQDPGPRVHLLGEGIGASIINVTGGGLSGLIVKGNTSIPNIYTSIQGFTFKGISANGISFEDCAFVKVSDTQITGFSTGIYAIDTLSSLFERVILRFNVNGFRFERTTLNSYASNPNAITMISCVVGNNSNYGGWVVGAGTFTMVGGSVEGNGTSRSGSLSQWGLRFTDPGGDAAPESSSAFNLQGIYFEANGGISDLWIESTETVTGLSGSIVGCSFNRISSVYTTNNIRCEASKADAGFPIALVGCGFRGIGGYSASASRLCINNANERFLIHPIACNYSSNLDKYKIPVPASTNSPGVQGMITSDGTYLYICVEDNVWWAYGASIF